MSLQGTTETTVDEKGEMFQLLSNHRRRWTIHLCKQADDPLSLGDLAEQIAAMEEDKTVPEIGSAERKRVYTSLQQTHLPRLAEAGMIEFENHTVTLTEEAESLRVYMDIVPAGSIPWGTYYAGLSIIAGIAVVLLHLEILPLSGTVVAALIVLAYGISAAVHVYESQKHRLGDDLPFAS